MKTIAFLTCVVMLGLASSAEAHQSSFTYGRIELADDEQSMSYRLKLKSTDLYEAIGLEGDRDATNEEILAGANVLTSYVRERLTLEVPGPEVRTNETTGHDRGRPRPLRSRHVRLRL